MFITSRPTLISLVLSLVAVVIGLNAGCTRDNPAFNLNPNLPDQCREGEEVSETFSAFERPDRLDILVVVDGSRSAGRLQSALARAMPDLLEPLSQEKIHTRVAFMTPDARGEIGLAPAGTQGASCTNNKDQIADSKIHNNWQTIAACNALQGESGDSYLRVFDVLEHALLEKPETLESFRRDDARLLIVVVTNEDDCSEPELLGAIDTPVVRNHCLWNAAKLRDVKDYTEKLLADAHSPEGISLAVISGPPTAGTFENKVPVQGICTGGFGTGYPANRLYQAALYFGDSGRYFNVCINTLTQPMRDIARDLALVDSITLCPAEPLAHEPISIQTMRDDVPLELGIGEEGVVFLGRTKDCENGAISVSSSALHAIDEVKTTYCVLR